MINVRYSSDLYYMAGKQFGLDYSSNNSDFIINNLHDNVMLILSSLLERYGINDDEIVYVQLILS